MKSLERRITNCQSLLLIGLLIDRDTYCQGHRLSGAFSSPAWLCSKLIVKSIQLIIKLAGELAGWLAG